MPNDKKFATFFTDMGIHCTTISTNIEEEEQFLGTNQLSVARKHWNYNILATSSTAWLSKMFFEVSL